jgi:hypothetical protein
MSLLECHFAKCRLTKCHSAECRGASICVVSPKEAKASTETMNIECIFETTLCQCKQYLKSVQLKILELFSILFGKLNFTNLNKDCFYRGLPKDVLYS